MSFWFDKKIKAHPIEDAFWPESLELNLCNCVGPAPGEKKCKCQIKEEAKWQNPKS